MPVRHRLVLFACLLSGLPAVAIANETENWNRLRAMPRERRLALAESLKQFDALDHAERSSIRKLDAQIAELPPAEQVRYRATLRRYHLWVQSLSGDQKEQIKRAQPGRERMALVSKLHKAQRTALASGGAAPLSIRLIPLTPRAPVGIAASSSLDNLTPSGEPRSKSSLNRGVRPARAEAFETPLDQSKPFRSFPDADRRPTDLDAELKKSGEAFGWFQIQDESAAQWLPKAGEKDRRPRKGCRNAANSNSHCGKFLFS